MQYLRLKFSQSPPDDPITRLPIPCGRRAQINPRFNPPKSDAIPRIGGLGDCGENTVWPRSATIGFFFAALASVNTSPPTIQVVSRQVASSLCNSPSTRVRFFFSIVLRNVVSAIAIIWSTAMFGPGLPCSFAREEPLGFIWPDSPSPLASPLSLSPPPSRHPPCK